MGENAVLDQCYFNGDFYQAVVATNAGDTPLSAPAKWCKVQVPAAWRWVLTQLTYAHLLELDGQSDKAADTRKKALESERIGLTDMIRREANAELRRLVRTDVQTPYNATSTTVTGLRGLHLPPNSYPVV